MSDDKQSERSNPGRNGNKLRVGNPGNKGGTGRPRNEFKQFCEDLLRQPNVQSTLERVLTDPDSRNYGHALKYATAYGQGLPTEHVSITSTARVVHTIQLPPIGAEIPEQIPEAQIEALPSHGDALAMTDQGPDFTEVA